MILVGHYDNDPDNAEPYGWGDMTFFLIQQHKKF